MGTSLQNHRHAVCSCFLCKHDPYNRFAFKKDTKRIINETLD